MKNTYKVGDLVYDAGIYDGMNTNMGDLAFYKKWLSKNKSALILELCCGTGRLTLPLAKEGYDIMGIDYTPAMLEQAKVKAKKEGLEVTFIEADMRTFELPDTYDLIFIPFNSIHPLYKNEDFFNTMVSVRKHLKEDGLFVFDCFNPNMKFILEGEKEVKEISKYTTADGREVVLKETMRYENSTQINRIEWHYYINGKFDSIQNLDMRLFFPQELDAYLEFAGFTIQHKFGSFEEEPFNANSDKQIYVCQ